MSHNKEYKGTKYFIFLFVKKKKKIKKEYRREHAPNYVPDNMLSLTSAAGLTITERR